MPASVEASTAVIDHALGVLRDAELAGDIRCKLRHRDAEQLLGSLLRLRLTLALARTEAVIVIAALLGEGRQLVLGRTLADLRRNG